jgi:hypothetical protein
MNPSFLLVQLPARVQRLQCYCSGLLLNRRISLERTHDHVPFVFSHLHTARMITILPSLLVLLLSVYVAGTGQPMLADEIMGTGVEPIAMTWPLAWVSFNGPRFLSS